MVKEELKQLLAGNLKIQISTERVTDNGTNESGIEIIVDLMFDGKWNDGDYTVVPIK